MARIILQLVCAIVLGLIAVPSFAAGWAYEDSTDKMDGTVVRFASVEANETVKPSFPYKSHKPVLAIRTRNGKQLDVMIQFSGQVNRSDIHGGSVRIKFDDSKPVSWPFGMPDNAGRTGLIFLNNERGFLDRLMKSKLVSIELDYYSHGKEVVSFPVVGFDPKRLGMAK